MTKIFLYYVGILIITASCGDLVNQQELPNKKEEPNFELKLEPKKPKVISENPKTPETQDQKLNDFCEAERQWAFTTGQIDAAQLRLFRNKNFAPVYQTSGQRQTGIEGWFQCERALRMNGFIH